MSEQESGAGSLAAARNREEGSDHAAELGRLLERERRFVHTLSRIAVEIGPMTDLREMVQLVTDEATALTGAQFGAFFYNSVRREAGAYSLYTISGAPISKFERFPMPRATKIFRPTFEGAETVRLDDVRADPRFGQNPPYNGLPAGHLPVRSYLAVPVFTPDGATVGGLFFGHQDVGVFTEEHERVVAAIAVHAGAAIDKAQLLAAERAARAEAEARSRAATALEVVDDAVILVDREGVIRLWNPAASAITGLDVGSVVGRPIGEALPAWERIVLDVPVGAEGESPAPATLPLDTLARGERWISIYGVAFDQGTVYAFRDVTGQHALEELHAEIIATVSHELRTPITAIYGAAQTLRQRSVDVETAEKLFAIIDGESERLTNLVDDILLTSQIEAAVLKIERTAFDPRSAVQAAMQAVPDADTVLVDAPENLADAVGDRESVRQVLLNLIENALKYGRQNGDAAVTVRIKTSGNSIRFEVADNGPGIPADEQTNIFEKFYRLDPLLTQGVRGTGLGLYICRELVERMQGRIGVASARNAGATFWFELPMHDPL